MYKPHTICRACANTELASVLNLGLQPLANDFTAPDGERAGYAPLEVLLCAKCGLAQLSVVVRPDILYSNYPYVTSRSETMRRHFESLWDTLKEEVNPEAVIEIGSNDGGFLRFARERGASQVCGIDPADNLAEKAIKDGIVTIRGLFDTYNANIVNGVVPRPDLIVARHVFAHIDDWQAFIKHIGVIAQKETLVVIEVPDADAMLRQVWFDKIYHEHLSYVSTSAVSALLHGSSFYLHRVERFPIHGGVLVLMLRRNDSEQYRRHLAISVITQDWPAFRQSMLARVSDLQVTLRKLHRDKKVVCGYGASATSTVWMGVAKLTKDHVQFMVDNTPQKQGKVTPFGIPILPESALANADYAVIFAHVYAQEIMDKNKAWHEAGGKWIIPLPELMVL